MNDDTTCTGFGERDAIEINPTDTYTRVASCAFGNSKVERRRQSLRARLERENYERQLKLENSFITTFRNLLSLTKH